MTKDISENQQLPKMVGILRDGKDDGRNHGSKELSINWKA
jgi:hypothetical protein